MSDNDFPKSFKATLLERYGFEVRSLLFMRDYSSILLSDGYLAGICSQREKSLIRLQRSVRVSILMSILLILYTIGADIKITPLNYSIGGYSILFEMVIFITASSYSAALYKLMDFSTVDRSMRAIYRDFLSIEGHSALFLQHTSLNVHNNLMDVRRVGFKSSKKQTVVSSIYFIYSIFTLIIFLLFPLLVILYASYQSIYYGELNHIFTRLIVIVSLVGSTASFLIVFVMMFIPFKFEASKDLTEQTLTRP